MRENLFTGKKSVRKLTHLGDGMGRGISGKKSRTPVKESLTEGHTKGKIHREK